MAAFRDLTLSVRPRRGGAAALRGRRTTAIALARLPTDRKDRNPWSLPERRHINVYRHELQICFDILTLWNIWSIIRHGFNTIVGLSRGFSTANGDGRSVVCDDVGAWARRARGFPQRQRRPVECRSRIAYRPVAADGVAADLHAGAARLSQARHQGALRTRPRRPSRGLSGAVGAKSPANGTAADARFCRLC